METHSMFMGGKKLNIISMSIHSKLFCKFNLITIDIKIPREIYMMLDINFRRINKDQDESEKQDGKNHYTR